MARVPTKTASSNQQRTPSLGGENRSSCPISDLRADGFERLSRVKGSCRRHADGTAGLPSAPEMPCGSQRLRLVPIPTSTGPPRTAAGPFDCHGRHQRLERRPGPTRWTPVKACVKSARSDRRIRRSRRSCWNKAGPVGAGGGAYEHRRRLPILVAGAVLLAQSDDGPSDLRLNLASIAQCRSRRAYETRFP
jgi:hypothetical protein